MPYAKAYLFAETSFGEISRRLLHQGISQIHAENTEYLLNVNETEYLAHLETQLTLEPILFHVDKMSMDAEEQMISADRFPVYQFGGVRGVSIKRQIFTFHIPFSGTADLLKCQPSQSAVLPYTVQIGRDEIIFQITDIDENAERVKTAKEQMLKALEISVASLANDVLRHNSGLGLPLRMEFEKRKSEILRQRKIAESIGVPIRKKSDLPATFAVQVNARKKVVPKPTASSEPYVQEPTLDDSVYKEILQVIEDSGRVIERHPSLYEGKDEEGLRDYLIFQLEPRFEGSTTGETFNKSGKTDILMRYEGKNLFVAECKFWRGAKSYLDALDQLMGYLTWRDSKTALICFVDNKEITPVLEAISARTSEHPNFVRFKTKAHEGRFEYEFHLPGDRGRAVHVAVLCFHVAR
jgi:hypothetical protein